ncbi:MAG: [FeFe]-hydrogenase [Streblomastix strix]|uniref:[FeFe]-hydrogenase n=1 Tax=Streblomastix strix TaxID=222440 RepID=A0A5J4UZF0_9EUKA|nr:MAG: [FeFe]-hydrogenase [Streblomastix strix]
MPSQIVDVLRKIRQKLNVVAMPAPSLMLQFDATTNQLKQALIKLGFSDVVEVALGADLTSINEAEEFLENVATGKQPLMTTSCCPAWVRAVSLHAPNLGTYVSSTGSPMKYTGDLVKQRYPDAITVFIGPCTAKRTEGISLENVDHVLTAEELLCIFQAAEIDPKTMLDEELGTTRIPSQEGSQYCQTQNVTQAVIVAVPKASERIKSKSQELGEDLKEIQPIFISPLDKRAFKQLRQWNDDISSVPGNLIEVMCCDGGCVGGSGNISAPQTSVARLKTILPKRPLFNDIEDIENL